MALLDQQFGWGEPHRRCVAGRSPRHPGAVRRRRDGRRPGCSLADATATRADRLNKQLYTIVRPVLHPASARRHSCRRRPAASAWRCEPYFRRLSPDERNLLETDAAVTDAPGARPAPALGGLPETARRRAHAGMLFWYHVLAAGRRRPRVEGRARVARTTRRATTAGGAVCVDGSHRFDVAVRGPRQLPRSPRGPPRPLPASTTTVAVGAPIGRPVDLGHALCDPGEGRDQRRRVRACRWAARRCGPSSTVGCMERRPADSTSQRWPARCTAPIRSTTGRRARHGGPGRRLGRALAAHPIDADPRTRPAAPRRVSLISRGSC